MAGVTFMDLLLAQALAAGLEREARSADEPPPENFFRLPSDPGAWSKLQEAWKKENMVVALEVTDGSFPQFQSAFMDIAREFDNIPFLRVQIGAGRTFDKLREDLGGVEYVPTFLVVFFGDDGTYRAKYERGLEVREALQSGRFKEVIKDFMERRVKLKLAGRLASDLADHVTTQMNSKEHRIRQEYEDRMRRQMAERDEQAKKEEEEKKHREEEERQKQELKKMQDNKRRKQARPEHIDQLRKLNLKTAPIKEIKTTMHEMGIGTTDCFERGDLLEKLMKHCPELRLAQVHPHNPPTSYEATDGAFDSKKSTATAASQGKSADSELEDMKRKVSSLETQLAVKTKEVERLKMASKSSANIRPGISAEERVKELELQLLETRMLYTTTLNDIIVQGIIRLPGSNEEGLVLRVRCTNKYLPNRGRDYAMKVLTDYFMTLTTTEVRATFQNEYHILYQLPTHKNIIKLWAFFFERTDPQRCPVFAKLKPAAQNKRSLFLLMDGHTTNMKDCLDTLVSNQGPNPAKVVQWLQNLLEGLVFLDTYSVVHRDLKLDNLLLDEDGNLVISDFGNAVLLEDSMILQYYHGYGKRILGGNTAHMCPEVLNARQGQRISYLKQPVWAAGVLAYELAGHKSPFEGGNIDQRGYNIAEVPALKHTFATAMKYYQPLPAALTKLVGEMIDFDPVRRPTLRDCLKKVTDIRM